MAAPVILVDAMPRRAVDGVAVPVRLAGGGAVVPYHYGGEHYRAGIAGLPKSIASLDFDGEQLGGGGVAQALELRWSPGRNAPLAEIGGLFWSDAPITVRIGPEGGALPPVEASGLVLDASADDGVLRLVLADQATDLKRPALTDRHAGTGGIEGPIEWEGQIKSRAWGRCFNVPGRVIKGTIWCFGDPRRPWRAFVQVRTRGVAIETLTELAWQGSAEATFAALDALAVPAGTAVACPSIACVKWWTDADNLHADIHGETAGGYVETAPAIAARIVAARSALTVDADSLTAAIASRPAPFGWRIDSEGATAAGELSQMLADVSLSWLIVADRVVFRPWQWTAPRRVARSHGVTRRQVYKPVATRNLGYRRNWSPMARGDLAAIVLAKDVVYEDLTSVEALKPAEPGATNSADPTSPFGPDGTVGGTIKQLTDIDRAIIAAKAREDVLLNDTIPAIDDAIGKAGERITAAREAAAKAVADANTRIDGANKLLDEEIARAVGADEDFEQRLEQIVASGGDANEELRASVEREATARADEDRAISQRVDTVKASVDTVDSRIAASATDITNTFTRADLALSGRSTVLEASAANVSTGVVRNDTFNVWTHPQPMPAGWAVWVAQGNFSIERGAPGRVGQFYVRTRNDVPNVESGFYQTVGTAGPGKWVVEVTVASEANGLSGAGVTLHGVWNIDFCGDPDTNGRIGNSSDGEVRSWSKMFDLDGRDQINVHAMLGWSGFGRTIVPKYLTWHRLSLRPATDGEIKAGKADAALNAPGGVLAKMTGYDATLADLPNRYATAQSVQTLEAQVNFAADSGLQRTINARIEDRATVIADAKAGAVAEQVRLLTVGGGTLDQRIAASANDITRGYTDADRALGTRATTLEAAASTVSSSAVFNDIFNFWPDGATLPSRWFLWQTGGNFRTNRLAPGRGGGQYCVQTLNDVAEVDSGFFQTIYTAGAGKWVIEVTVNGDTSGLRGAGVTLSGVPGWNIDFLSDSDVSGRVGDSQGEVRSWSKMVDLDGRDQISVHAMHGWAGFGRGMAAKYMVWHRLALRPATDGEIKAGKADAALNNPGGVLAKMTGYDATLADLPNRYATAQSVQTLEAQVNFAADSGLQRTINARIEDRATVIADGKAGAVAETVRVLRGEYNGTVGEVREQRGVLNGLNGKTAAYVRLIADAGNGRAALSLWSDQYGGAWQLTGNGAIDGNLTVNGTITARAFNGPTMTYEVSSSWSGNVTSSAGQTTGVPWSLTVPTIPAQGRFIYEFSVETTTNAGTTQYGGVDPQGRPVTINYVADGGGLVIEARDAQGNAYSPIGNGSQRVIAASDFSPTFTASVRQGTRDERVDGGDFVTYFVAATYTVTRIRLKVTWVAI